MKTDFAPVMRDKPNSYEHSSWQGSDEKKPWHYRVTAVVPCMDTSELVTICVQLLRLQSDSPFIIVIDTGSQPEELEKLHQLRASDLEVHSIALNGVRHPSDFPAMAMDLGFAVCRTEYLFATHADCFLRRRNLLEDMVRMCKMLSPVVGYEISPRKHKDWKGMVSHTATMYHMPIMDKIGFGWSMRRLSNLYNIVDYSPNPMRPGWPDTEILGNYLLRQHRIEPHLIGSEENFARTIDDNIDHFRSYTASQLYNDQYYKMARGWFESAKAEALERIESWKEWEKGRGEQ